MSRLSNLVYSTASGRICPDCAKPVTGCQCRQQASGKPAPDGIVRIRRETKGRNGKGVTLIDGLPLDAAALTALAKVLKNKCGSGGTVKDGVIEIQGDHRELVKGFLDQNGYRVKLAGG
ncbi:MAG: translation initiation factor Sui1 [Gammaproteobacteria bacterium]|nr:translation initiation factor Sui1 [Gammaproteobacteria bacterium]MDP2139213.1 translation initiation factor Sui1 [Gammaproteobacteria bacterium]MDP2349018.1 translation initiation factor Sui1 [Gammaproteobacteria bacterium]